MSASYQRAEQAIDRAKCPDCRWRMPCRKHQLKRRARESFEEKPEENTP